MWQSSALLCFACISNEHRKGGRLIWAKKRAIIWIGRSDDGRPLFYKAWRGSAVVLFLLGHVVWNVLVELACVCTVVVSPQA